MLIARCWNLLSIFLSKRCPLFFLAEVVIYTIPRKYISLIVCYLSLLNDSDKLYILSNYIGDSELRSFTESELETKHLSLGLTPNHAQSAPGLRVAVHHRLRPLRRGRPAHVAEVAMTMFMT